MKNMLAASVYALIAASIAFAGGAGPGYFNGASQIMPATVVGPTGTATSSPLDMRQFEAAAIQVKWAVTGATGVTGSFTIQSSVDYTPSTASSATWSQLSAVGSTGPNASTSGNAMFDISATSAPWLQVTYTGVAGNTGTFSVKAAQKSP